MCNCISECEKNLKEHLLKTYSKGALDTVEHCMIASTWIKGQKMVIMKANVIFTMTQKKAK